MTPQAAWMAKRPRLDGAAWSLPRSGSFWRERAGAFGRRFQCQTDRDGREGSSRTTLADRDSFETESNGCASVV